MNRTLISVVCGLLAAVAAAQQPAPSQEQMMNQAMEMQACFANLDQQALAAIGEQAQRMAEEVKSLCQAGKREQAQNTAIQFGKTVARDKTVQAARECGEMMRGMMPNLDYPTSEEEMKGRHVCDSY